jgi:hypothetical protein
MKKTLILIALIFTFGSGVSLAQTDSTAATDSTFYLITKTDGGEFYGFILSDDGREILLQTATIGKIFIAKSDIESIKEVNTERVNTDGTIRYEDFRATGPFTTRYFITTNALPVEKDEDYAMIHLYGPEAHFAINDNFSLGVMSTWIASPIAIAAKYSFDSETDVHYSLGTMLGSSGYLANANAFGGLHWVTVTQGNRKKNISLSAGVAYVSLGRYFYGSNQRTVTGSAVLSVAGIAPVGKKASFIFDAMSFTRKAQYTPQGYNNTPKDVYRPTFVIMPGMRFNQKHGSAFQVTLSGFVHVTDYGYVNAFPAPMISWLRQF